jgi:AraC-like DNA-binding protein
MDRTGTRLTRLSDVDALASHLTVAPVAASPLRAGPFALDMVDVGLGDVGVRVGRSTPLLVLGAFPPGAAGLVLPLRSDQALVLNGSPARPYTVAVHGEGAPLEGAGRADFAWALLCLRTAALERLEPPRGSPVLRRGAAAVLACDPAASRGAAALLRDAARVASTAPEVFAVEAARRSLREAVLEAARELLAGPWGGPPPRALRSPTEGQRLVRAADEVLRAEPGRAATAADVAAALGVPVERLRRAVRTVFGVGAQQYMLLRRLTLQRGALRRAGAAGGDPPPRSVALAHGFWDLGRLARDHRRLFGEDIDVPGHGGEPRSEREATGAR